MAAAGSADGNVGVHCWKFVGRTNDRHLKKLRGSCAGGRGPLPPAGRVPGKAVRKPDADAQVRAGAVGKASREIAMPAIDISNHSGEQQP
jgi:hypothetical protein